MRYQSDFDIEEFADRRGRLAGMLEAGSAALFPGAAVEAGHDIFRQYNTFYYFCGLEVPHAYLLIDTDRQTSTVFLQDSSHTRFPVDDADRIKKMTGLDEVVPLSELRDRLADYDVLYVPERDGEGRKESPDTLAAWGKAVMADPFDQRLGRVKQVVSNIKAAFPSMEIKELSSLVDELRMIKSEAEIDLLRKAGEATAVGAIEAMRNTRSGIMEYQLDAVLQYVYKQGGASGESYHSIIPGSANAGDTHYIANCHELRDGDIVLLDGAPDYHYYTSDIGRMWPISGRFSPEQKALYGYLVQYHKTLLGLLRPGVTKGEVHACAAETMKPVFEKWEFFSDNQRETARLLFDFPGHVSHGVGMCVHDVSLHDERPFEPGMVFAVDPMAWDQERETYYRIEDTVVIVEEGCLNLTCSCPIEIDEIELIMSIRDYTRKPLKHDEFAVV